MNDMSDHFATRLNGRFQGVMQWSDLDALWARVRADPDGWYASLTGEAPPDAAMTADETIKFIAEIDGLLHREHEFDYCGVVYVDDPDSPGLIKIFDPHNMGSGCRVGGAPIPPQWVLSRCKPSLMVNDAPLSNSRRRWWQNLFGHGV